MASPPTEPSSGVWIGIDLGTSNSACAIWDSTRGSPKWIRLPVIAFREKGGKLGRMVPSVVRVTEGSKPNSVGAKAVQENNKEATADAGMLISSVKRLFGKRYSELDPALLESLPFHVEADENDEDSLQLVIPISDGHDEDDCVLVVKTTPVEIAASILKAIKEAAQEYVDKNKTKKHLEIPGEGVVRNAVVGVPAHFSKRHTALVEEACRQAGLDGHVSTCLESTAAAMAYGLAMQDSSSQANIMVIDMGGGTTDITIATKQDDSSDETSENYSSYKVLVTQGDDHLGGDDIDQAVLDYCMQEVALLKKKETELKRSDFLIACRKAKEQLCDDSESKVSSVDVAIGDHSVTISQEKFHSLLKEWLKKAEHLIQRALEEFQKIAGSNSISEVILVGGTTRVPSIRALIQSKFSGLELCTSLNPMSSVAQGLAIQAAIQSKLVPVHKLKSALMLDCVPHAIGVQLPDGSFCEVIPRNTPLPARGSATFSLADKAQKGITIKAVEEIEVNGANDTTIYYEPIGKEPFTFLLRRLAKEEMATMNSRSIEVGMKVDAAGQFMVSIFDQNDPEQVRKKERFESMKDKDAVGELSYITDLVLSESGTSREQFMLTGTLVGVFILYIAVKMAFNDPILEEGEM
eukprot:CAMPEP_0113631500 /NCGR_PEP_ID=MMETSP0017_2-20120614/16370_1 /TAXON_ID=2856 /ORGANISM="Cylindrotheca closterium" /LENGTH=635 /DNA_ID=CAMNT_0000542013 /DNA_START=52 /DNA_END=1959 /DNA_ORIENTATION=- /assembly_acc=CAM_ASM_000147